MPDLPEKCGECWSGEDYLPPCQLAKGHDGDHVTAVSWPQWAPRPPRDPNEPQGALERIMQSAWGTTVAHALTVRPVFPTAPGDSITIINRDTEEDADA